MPSIKGTASVADARERSKALKSTRFPASFSKKVKLDKVNKAVMTQWIEKKVTSILGFDDEIVSSTAINLFFPSDGRKPDPKRAQLDLVGFLGEGESATFAKELWDLLVEAQESPSGIPRSLLEAKKKEIAEQKQQPQLDHERAEYRAQAPEANRIVDMPPGRADEGGPVRIPVSPTHPTGDYHPQGDCDRSTGRNDRKRRAGSPVDDRKLPARRSNPRSRYDRRHPQPPLYRGDMPPPSYGRRARERSRSAEFGPPPGRYGPPPGEDEFRRTNDWRRENSAGLPPPPPPARYDLPDDRRNRGDSWVRRRYYSEEEEMDDLERRLSSLKRRLVRRGENYALDDEIDDIEYRLDELDRRRRRRMRETEEERRGDRREPRARSHSSGRRPPLPGPPRYPSPRRRRRSESSSSDDSRQRSRSPSTGSSVSSRSFSSRSSASSRSSRSSPSRLPPRRGRSRSVSSRSRSSSSRPSSEDSRR